MCYLEVLEFGPICYKLDIPILDFVWVWTIFFIIKNLHALPILGVNFQHHTTLELEYFVHKILKS